MLIFSKRAAEALEALRPEFERLSTCTHGFSRSRRGTYTNPATARDWKWFQFGAIAARRVDP